MADRSRHAVDDLLITALARGDTHKTAAAVAGISTRTLQRRLEDDGFQGRVRKSRADLLSTATGKLTQASSDAADVLHRLITQSNSEKIQLGAAKAILDSLVKIHSLEQLEERLANLEQLVAELTQP